jgi:dephospho-CoA kinase
LEKEGDLMLILGLTGGIATGKSTVAEMLEKLGAYRIDADKISREVVQPGMPAWREIVEHFGPGVLFFNRQLNRHALASVIFHDPQERAKLEEFTHPPIKDMIREQILIARKSGAKVALLEVPLLYETGLAALADKVVVVVADETTMIERMLMRDNLNKEEARLRIKAQMSLAEKARKADYVIYNTGTSEELKIQVENLWREMSEFTREPVEVREKAILWSSDNDKVAKVTDEGEVIPVGPGTATITAKTSDGGYSASCLVKVQAPPQHTVFAVSCTKPLLATSSNEILNFQVSVRPVAVKELGYDSVRLNVAVYGTAGGTSELMTLEGGRLSDAAARGYCGPAGGFAMPRDYSADFEFRGRFDTPGRYNIIFTLVDLADQFKVLTSCTVQVEVQAPPQVSVYRLTADLSGLQFVAGSEGTIIPLTIRASEVKQLGYEACRLHVDATGPAVARVELLAQKDGVWTDAAHTGYIGPANGFPITGDHRETISVIVKSDTPGIYNLHFTLVDLSAESKVIAEENISIEVEKAPEPSLFDFCCDTQGLRFIAGSETGTVIPLSIGPKEVRNLGYERVRINVAVNDRPPHSTVELITAAGDGRTKDAAALGYIGPPSGYTISKDYSETFEVHTRFDRPGHYSLTFTLVDVNDAFREICSCLVTAMVEAVPEPSLYRLHCDTRGLRFLAGDEEGTVLPVDIVTREVKDLGYESVRFNVSLTSRPPGAKAQLLAKSGRGRIYDTALLGYWGPVTGFALGKDYTAQVEFVAKFDTVGDYMLTFSLTDLNGETDSIAALDVPIRVQPQPEPSTYELVCDLTGISFVAGSDAETVLPVTIRPLEVKELGYESVKLFVAVTRKPARAAAHLLVLDNGKLRDLTERGFYGPEEGFVLTPDYTLTIDLITRFDTVGAYTISFTLADLKEKLATIARKRITVNVELEAAGSEITGVALDRNAVLLTAGGKPVTLKAILVKALPPQGSH